MQGDLLTIYALNFTAGQLLSFLGDTKSADSTKYCLKWVCPTRRGPEFCIRLVGYLRMRSNHVIFPGANKLGYGRSKRSLYREGA